MTMTQSASKLPAKIQRTKLLVFIGYYGLVVYFLINAFSILASPNLSTLVIWMIQIAPLLIFLPGLHRNTLRTFGWLCFVSLFYFVHAVLVSFTPGRLVYGLIEIAFCCLLFVSLIIFIRQYRDHYQVSL